MSSIVGTPSRAVFVVIAALALGACQKIQQAAAPAGTTPPQGAPAPAAIVNGEPIPRSVFDLAARDAAQRVHAQELNSDQKNEILDQLVRAQLAAGEAVKNGLDKDAEVSAQLALLRIEVLASAEQKKFIKEIEPTDAELHTEYDADVAQMDKTEYKARHILVQNKEQAEQVIKRLKAGAKFEDLAKAQSIDPSKNNGGELGWFTAARMVKPFSDAVKGLKKGEYTQEPVQTQFGWHVIQLEDTREVTPPPFDQVKARLADNIRLRKWKEHIDGLQKDAKIEKKV